MEKHPIWVLAKKHLGWDGGTIHQLAKEVGVRDYADLIMQEGQECWADLQGRWQKVQFESYDYIDDSGVWATVVWPQDGDNPSLWMKHRRVGVFLRERNPENEPKGLRIV